jgi:hypothetical protein
LPSECFGAYRRAKQGGLVAAGVTYAAGNYPSTWAWRLPSLVQGVFSALCIVILPFVPESPRWLVRRGRADEARRVLALTLADGDEEHASVRQELRCIEEAVEAERASGQTMAWGEMVRTGTARKRVLLAVSAAVFSTIAGTCWGKRRRWTGLTGSRECRGVVLSWADA